MLDLAAAYAETQANLAELVRGLPEDRVRMIVPASPDWDVKDVVAHLAGEASDMVTGTFPHELNLLQALDDPVQAGLRESMTARQVAERSGRSLDAILEEWSGQLEPLLLMIRGERLFPVRLPFLDAILVGDLAVHAQDVRGALGVPGDRHSAGVSTAFVMYCGALALRLGHHGLPALRIRYGGKERILGDGEPGATWTGERFEIFRALTGRRSRDQILGMEWEGDPAPYLPLIPAFGPRNDPIAE